MELSSQTNPKERKTTGWKRYASHDCLFAGWGVQTIVLSIYLSIYLYIYTRNTGLRLLMRSKMHHCSIIYVLRILQFLRNIFERIQYIYMAVCQNLVPLVNIKIAGDPYPYIYIYIHTIYCLHLRAPGILYQTEWQVSEASETQDPSLRWETYT